MIHYNFLKLTQAADAEAVLARCREVYAELEAELDFLHDAKVSRLCGCLRLWPLRFPRP